MTSTQNTQKPHRSDCISEPSSAPESATPTRFRPSTRFLSVSSGVSKAPDAVEILARLHIYRSVFEAARSNRLPNSPLTTIIGGEQHAIEPADLIELEADWKQQVSECRRDERDLTRPEAVALDATTELLETVLACWDDETWLDLQIIEAKLIADFKAMREKQHTVSTDAGIEISRADIA